MKCKSTYCECDEQARAACDARLAAHQLHTLAKDRDTLLALLGEAVEILAGPGYGHEFRGRVRNYMHERIKP